MPPILTIIPLIQSALSVIGSFNGSAQLARTTGYIQEAVGVVGALTPLVQQFTNGTDVTPEMVRTALAGKDVVLAEFDRLIAAKEAKVKKTEKAKAKTVKKAKKAKK